MTEQKNGSLNRPTRPQGSVSEGGATQTPTSEQRALATSTSIAHGMRKAINSQVDHISGIQEAYSQAVEPIADEASDLFAGAISGEILWQEIAQRTQQKLDSLPKPARVDLTPKQLRPFCLKRSEGTNNRFLSSSATAFLNGGTECA